MATHRQPPVHTYALGDAARDAAIRALAGQARAYPNLHPDPLQTAALDARDAGLARAIYTAAVRRWITLAYLLDRQIRQGFDGLERPMKGVLLAGGAQLLFLDRVPAHAAINHAVEWAKQNVRPGAGGLVNAVLRRIADLRAGAAVAPGPWVGQADTIPLDSGEVLLCGGPVLPDEALDRLAVATSHPRAILEHWSVRHADERLRKLALHSLVEPPVVLSTGHAALPLNDFFGAATAPHAHSHHRVVIDESATIADLLASARGVWVQDAASGEAVRSVADLKPRLIVDPCAGQGTKTRQLAATFPDAAIVATDIDPTRFATLQTCFRGSAQVDVMPASRVRERCIGRADLVLLDVPCSNTGVLPRRPEARYRFSRASVESLSAVQREIVEGSIPLLAHGGRILYSTCSLEAQENGDQAAWMGGFHGFRAEREQSIEPSGVAGDSPTSYRDGAYSVLLSRRS